LQTFVSRPTAFFEKTKASSLYSAKVKLLRPVEFKTNIMLRKGWEVERTSKIVKMAQNNYLF